MVAKSILLTLVLAAHAGLINAMIEDCSPSSSTWGSCDTEEEKSSLLQTKVSASEVKKEKEREIAKKEKKQNSFSGLGMKWELKADTLLQALMSLKDLPQANMTQIVDIGQIVQDSLLPGLLEAHNFSQTQLDESKSRLDTCNTAASRGLIAVAPLQATTASAQDNHTACREEQRIKNENMTTTCELLTSFLTNTIFPDIGSSPQLPVARTALHEYGILAPQFVLLDAACNESTTIYDAKVIECDGLQAAYQSDFCEYRQSLLQVASTYGDCYAVNEDDYTSLYAQLQEKVVNWKAEYTSIRKIECYLQTWLAEANTNTINPNMSTSCEEQEVNTSSMDILPLVLDVPDPIVVDTSPVAEYPGTTGFPSVAYADISYNHDIPSCISETPAISVPTPSPPPAPTSPPTPPPTSPPTPPPTPPPTLAPTTAPTPTTWPLEGANLACYGSYVQVSYVSDQLGCQDQCLETCVGILYSYKEGSTQYCYTCGDDVLTGPTYNDFGFYRKP